ncbi:hypothetical protein MBLNU13_g05126t1 [Cladosporium sp. NU13]
MAMTLQQPVAFSASGRQQHHKMSIAFLAGQANEDTVMSDSCYAPAPAPASLPVAAPTFQMPCYQPEGPRTPITLPSLRLDGSPYSNGSHSAPQLPRIGSFSSINSFSSAHSANSWGSSNASYPNSTASSFSSINTSPVKRHDSIWDNESNASAASSATSYHSSNSFSSINVPHPHHHHHHHHHHQPTHSSMVAEPLARIPRPARPSYSEEQKFFIMYYRVIKELSWPEIEDKFATFFNLRTKDGLTSVYYRIRKNWGMEEVLKTGPDGSMGDRGKVESKAAHFSREFLTNLGYFD